MIPAFMPIALHDLNPQQREAVLTTEGPLLVLAGAGSGKTRVITYRIAHLLDQGVAAKHIVAVSFTNKAAEEMRERVQRLVGGQKAQGLTLETFHALGLQILKSERTALGFPQGFAVYDTTDQLGVLREILREAHIADRRLDVKALLARISRLKNAGISPEQFGNQLAGQGDWSEYDGYAAEVYPRYQAKLRAFHALDFDDLLLETVRLLREDAMVRTRWQQRIRYLMVDEYQDTNPCQLELVQLLVGAHKNIAAVGDDDQSIYGWRGAVAHNIFLFQEHFPGAPLIKLEENYRSTQPILDAANAVIRHNPKRHPKTLWSKRTTGPSLQWVTCPDAEAEAQFVAQEMDWLRRHHQLPWHDMAVLYRSNVQARFLEEALREEQIPYHLIGGQAFFERKEVKDAMAYLKLLVYPRDEIALRRVINYPVRGLGPATLEALTTWHPQQKSLFSKSPVSASPPSGKHTLWDALLLCQRAEVDPPISPAARNALRSFMDILEQHRAVCLTQPLVKTAQSLLAAVGLQEDLVQAGPTPLVAQRRLRNLEGFVEALGRYEQRATGSRIDQLASYLHKLSLQNTSQDDDSMGNLVTLSTLHGAKGLEFQAVFLVGLEEDLLPHKRTLAPTEIDQSETMEPTDLSEERRLFYVGITRARERLYLSYAKFRGSRSQPRTPSRFVQDIPTNLLEKRNLETDQGPTLSPEEQDRFVQDQLAQLRALLGG